MTSRTTPRTAVIMAVQGTTDQSPSVKVGTSAIDRWITVGGTSRGTVIRWAAGTQAAITNYHGSFSVSIFERRQHAGQGPASFCAN